MKSKTDSTLRLQKNLMLSILCRMYSRITGKYFLLTTAEVNPRAYLQQQQLHSPFSHITFQPLSLDLSNSHCTSLVSHGINNFLHFRLCPARVLHAGYDFNSMLTKKVRFFQDKPFDRVIFSVSRQLGGMKDLELL